MQPGRLSQAQTALKHNKIKGGLNNEQKRTKNERRSKGGYY